MAASAMDNLNLQLTQAVIPTIKIDIQRGETDTAKIDITKAWGYANQIADPATFQEAKALVDEQQASLEALEQSGQASTRYQQAVAGDAAVQAGVLDRNTDPAYQQAGADEVADIRAGQQAQREGLDPDLAYNFGLGAARAAKTAKDAANVALPALGVTAAIVLGLFLVLLLLKVA